jgi:hypothetical protein
MSASPMARATPQHRRRLISYNPDPVAGTLNQYTHRAQWFNCSDTTQPGISAITNYLNSLPYNAETKCGTGQYWQAVNVNPAFTPKGLVQRGLVVPPPCANPNVLVSFGCLAGC